MIAQHQTFGSVDNRVWGIHARGAGGEGAEFLRTTSNANGDRHRKSAELARYANLAPLVKT